MKRKDIIDGKELAELLKKTESVKIFYGTINIYLNDGSEIEITWDSEDEGFWIDYKTKG